METINIEYGDILICDPGYIKFVGTEWSGELEPRFDLLRCEKVLHEGDDGVYSVEYNGEKHELGVDSGRIWQMRADFGGTIQIDAGFSGYWLIRKEEQNG